MSRYLKRRMTIVIEADVPDSHEGGVLDSELKAYIAEALSTWGGGGDPNDLLFAGVKVRKIKLPPRKDRRLVTSREWHA